jgi:CubicO group peptidase (beta-lactamase class C family)
LRIEIPPTKTRVNTVILEAAMARLGSSVAAVSLLFLCQDALALMAGAAVQESEAGPATLETELDRAIGEFVDSHPVPGLAVGVVKDGQVAYAKGFGITDLRTRRPVTSQSLFHTASVSKTFVATAIMQLVEQNKLELEATVMSYLEYFELDDDRARSITVRQLLSHTSGMPDVKDYHWDEPECDARALERYIRGLRNRRLVSPPGQSFRYSNMAYEVLGDVIAKVSGMPFEVYVQQHILVPLEMRHSTFLKEDTDTGLRTTPHVGRRRPEVSAVYPYNRAHAPSSTLHSSVAEMCNWIIANVNGGQFKDRRILQAHSYNEIWRPHAKVREGREMGLGWMLAECPYGPWIFHGGRDIGFRSHLTLLPEEIGGTVILSNTSDLAMPPLRDVIMKIAFAGGQPDASP